MAQKNRSTLKKYFMNGSRPSEEDFRDLIDSNVNILEDGFSRTPEDGIKLTPAHDSTAILSFYKNNDAEIPSWSLDFNEEEDLILQNRNIKKEAISFLVMKNGSIQLSADSVSISGLSIRQGACVSSSFNLRANGKWQDITEELDGMHAFEIVAGFEIPDKQQNFILQAWANHSYGINRRISTIGPNRICWGNKLLLRWVCIKDSYEKKKRCKLQIRTRRNYGAEEKIFCYITHLCKKLR